MNKEQIIKLFDKYELWGAFVEVSHIPEKAEDITGIRQSLDEITIYYKDKCVVIRLEKLVEAIKLRDLLSNQDKEDE